MTGPEHYRRAEALLDRAANAEGMGHAGEIIDRAQVHATLALTAATVECASDLSPREEFPGNGNYITQGANTQAWQEALS